MKISRIKALNNNKYEVTIDEKKHIILGDVLLSSNLLKPRDITKEEYNTLLETNSFYDNYRKIIRFISFKMRTETEIKKKLISLRVPSKMHNKIIQKIKDEGYLNDEKYLNSYINDQINLTLNGPKKINYNLQKLGFNEDIIVSHLDNISEDIWTDKIKKIIQKKQKANHKLPQNRFKQKLISDLKVLGYNEDMFISLIDDINIDDKDLLEKDYQKLYQKLTKKYNGDKLNMMIKQKLYNLGYDKETINMIVKS